MWCLVGAAVKTEKKPGWGFFSVSWRTKSFGETLGGNFLCCHRRYPPTCCSRREPLRRINLSSTFFFCFGLFFHFYFYVVFLLFSFENVSRVHFSSFHCFPPRDVGSRQTGYATNHAQQWGGIPPRLIPQLIPSPRENRCFLDASAPQRQSFFFLSRSR